MEAEYDEGLWALVLTSCGRFLGNIVSPTTKISSPEDLKLHSLAHFRTGLKLDPAYEMTIQTFPVPMGPGKVGMQREVSSGPVGLTLEEGAPLYLAAVGITFFEDMKPQDRARYKGLVDNARALCVSARAQHSGLVTAGPKGG